MWILDKFSNKKKKFSQISYNSIPEWNLKGKHFYAKILDIYDGDTVTITIKINKQYYRINCRLHNIDTPELRSSEEDEKMAAKMARRHLIFLLTKKQLDLDVSRNDVRKCCFEENPVFMVECGDFDKYGRLLINIFDNGGLDINKKMIEDGFAGEYDGKAKSRWTNYFMHLDC